MLVTTSGLVPELNTDMHLLIKYLYLGGWICLTSAEEGLSWRAGLEEHTQSMRRKKTIKGLRVQTPRLGSVHGGKREIRNAQYSKASRDVFKRVSPGAGQKGWCADGEGSEV